MSQFLTSLKEVKKNYKPYDQWEQQQADDVAKRAYLSKILDLPPDEVELTREKAQTVFRASDMMDKRSEDNCANMEQTTGLVGLAALAPFMFLPIMIPPKPSAKVKTTMEGLLKEIIKTSGPQIGFMTAVSIAIVLWGNAKQKEASRIGRFQARQHELKDPKNFVMYTPEQIEAAKIVARNLPNKKDNKNLSQVLKDMKQMSVDKKAYKQWAQERVKNPEDLQKILNTEFTEEQMLQGEKDKEIIVNIVKDVNMNAETYAENVENAFDTIDMLSFIPGAGAGYAFFKILNKMSKTPGKISGKASSVLGAIVVTLATLFWGTHEKKQGSKVGRFVKRQEILNNPELIMAYSPEQLKLAENIKGPKVKKGFLAKIKDNFTFFGTYFKDKMEYNKYKKTIAKENEKLYEALRKTDVSKEQLKEAKDLQKNTFRAFEKMDEMSQRYSEDTEAASEVFMQLISPVFSLTGMLGLPLTGYLVYKGKIPLQNIIKGLSHITIDKNSSIRKFVDEACKVINSDKNLKKDVASAIFKPEQREKYLKHPELQKHFTTLFASMGKYYEKFMNIVNLKDDQEVEKAMNSLSEEIGKEHLKKGPVSEWIRNLALETSKAVYRIKTKYKPNLETTNNQGKDGLNFIKHIFNEYKTICKTLLYGGLASIIGIGIGIPFAIASVFTNIQLKAGRIGIMKAMQQIDNPKLFVNAEDDNVKS